MSEHYKGPAPTNEELGLSRRVIEQETQYHRTSEQTRESLKLQRSKQEWEPLERMARGTIDEDVVVDASCPCPPISCRCVHNGTNQA